MQGNWLIILAFRVFRFDFMVETLGKNYKILRSWNWICFLWIIEL